MLRITAMECERVGPVLKLEGKLLEPWIGELHECCRRVCERALPATLDLTDLSYVDAPAAMALCDLQRRGVELTGCSPLIAELLKEYAS